MLWVKPGRVGSDLTFVLFVMGWVGSVRSDPCPLLMQITEM